MDSFVYDNLKNCKVRLECADVYNITVTSTNEDTAIEKALSDLFFNYSGKPLILISINKVLIYLDRYEHQYTSFFDVWGRKYRAGKDSVFLNRMVTLGRIETDRWDSSYNSFYTYMKPLIKCWLNLVDKDKPFPNSYQW